MNRHCELSGSFGKCESKLVCYAVYMKVNSCLRLRCAKKCPHLVCKVSRCPNAQTVFSAVPALLPAYYLRAKCPASRPASRHAATLATCKKTENSALSLPATNMSGIVETQDARRLLATFNGVSTTTASTTEDGNPGSDLEAMLRAQRAANPPGAADHSPHSTDAFDQDLAFDPHEITDMVTKHNTVSKPGRALPCQCTAEEQEGVQSIAFASRSHSSSSRRVGGARIRALRWTGWCASTLRRLKTWPQSWRSSTSPPWSTQCWPS
jgi:hypothetical protein